MDHQYSKQFISLEKCKKYISYYEKRERELFDSSDERMFIETTYGTTFIRTCGNRDGPKLLMLLGDTDNSLSWGDLLEELKSKYFLILPDPIFDYGKSTLKVKIRGKDDLVLWLEQLIKNMDLPNLSIVAYSYGCWYVALYAMKNPEWIEKLILISPARIMIQSPIYSIYRAVKQEQFPSNGNIKEYMEWTCRDSLKKEEAKRKVYEQIEYLIMCRDSFEHKKFLLPQVFTEKEWRKIRTPIKIIIGNNDFLFKSDDAVKRMKKLRKDINIIVFANVGHDILYLKPKEIGAEIMEFIKGSVSYDHEVEQGKKPDRL